VRRPCDSPDTESWDTVGGRSPREKRDDSECKGQDESSPRGGIKWKHGSKSFRTCSVSEMSNFNHTPSRHHRGRAVHDGKGDARLRGIGSRTGKTSTFHLLVGLVGLQICLVTPISQNRVMLSSALCRIAFTHWKWIAFTHWKLDSVHSLEMLESYRKRQ
jgi:hypothetical protein